MFCKQCGTKSEDSAKFCHKCGSSHGEDHANPSSAPVQASQTMEKEFVNEFGTITGDRLTFFSKRGWVKKGVRVDVSLKHVTSVTYRIKRRSFWGIFFLVAGLASLAMPDNKPGAFLAIGLGVMFLLGSPMITVNTAGNELYWMTGWPWKKDMAHEFTETLRKRLFKN